MGSQTRVLSSGAGPQRESIAAEVQQRFDAFVETAKGSSLSDKVADLQPTATILASSERDQIDTIRLCFELVDRQMATAPTSYGRSSDYAMKLAVRTHAEALASRLLRRRLPYTSDDLASLLDKAAEHSLYLPIKGVVGAIEKWLDGAPAGGELKKALERFRSQLSYEDYADARKLEGRLDSLLAGADRAGTFRVERVDAWTCALADHAGEVLEGPLGAFLEHCLQAQSSRPSKTWRKAVARLLDELGTQRHRDLLETVLPAIGARAPFSVEVFSSWGEHGQIEDDETLISCRYSDLLRGIIWSAVEGDLDAQVTALGDAAERCFNKVAGHGPRAPKVGNACLYALSQASSLDGVGQLSRLMTRVKHASVRAQLKKALTTAAERAGLSQADLEDIAVPTCGLTDVGKRIEKLGDFTAELRLVGIAGPELRWLASSGKVRKGVPAAVKSEFPDELAALRRSAKELKKMLPAQRSRIERMLLDQRTLRYAEWKARYWDHPLLGYLARRMIWRIGEEPVLLAAEGERLVDLEGVEHAPSDSAPVRLWHPIESRAGTVRAWREWLAEREVTQPFKQAHREIYILTDAERQTGTYSNRFAAHVLKQHQFSALCHERGWRYTLQGGWDSHNTPFIDLPEWGLRVEYRVDPAGDLQAEMTAAGVYLCIATDQVRFYRMHEDEPMRLEDVPPVVFSELLRDVDLFVGVCSVGNDPTWHNGGPNGRHHDYWQGYAFGGLAESAKTRRLALERIVPRLKIADRCTLADKFLSVRGELRTYHIHLGSGNILMSPNDEYLCIVPGRKAGSAPTNVMLPFEGDSMLSIILSKAFLLAADVKIRDPSIVSQIEHR